MSSSLAYLSGPFLQTELRAIFTSTLKSLKATSLGFLRNSVYLVGESKEGGAAVKDLQTLERFTQQWETTMAGPVFDRFLNAFQARVKEMLEDPEFAEVVEK